MRELNSIIAIAYRDFLKFLRDKPRIIATFMFPLIFIVVLGGSLDANLSGDVGYDFMTFVFTGVLGQVLFQSSAAGIISLIEDKENDFSQEVFVSPISRYSIIIGKIMGEAMVALAQGIGVIVLGFILQVPFTLAQLLSFLPTAIAVTLLGGAFGVFIMSMLPNQRAANQIFPFVLFPQFFAAGVFNPIRELPIYLWVISRIAPMTYAVDLFRSVYYFNTPESDKTVLFGLGFNLIVISIMFILFISLGTYIFIRGERNK